MISVDGYKKRLAKLRGEVTQRVQNNRANATVLWHVVIDLTAGVIAGIMVALLSQRIFGAGKTIQIFAIILGLFAGFYNAMKYIFKL